MRELHAVLQRALLRRNPDYLDEESFETASRPGSDSCEACRGHALKESRCLEIRSAHQDTGGNIARTAPRLGLSRTTVYKHIQ